MCDTVCSLNLNNSNQRITYFAKNSDRVPNEMQLVEYYPSSYRSKKVKVTYIEIEYSGPTNTILISRPYWMWGAEMGVNEYGVAIGNEALFTKNKQKNKSLLGMDLLRIALEKGKNADEAVDTVIEYLETYGQGGNNSFEKEEYYNNSFIITDWHESYILETVGKEWTKKKVNKFSSISNCITAQKDKDTTALVEQSGNVQFKSDLIYTRFGHGRERQNSTYNTLKSFEGNSSLIDIMSLMRSHKDQVYHPRFGSNRDVCMHSGPIPRRFQTVNSMITEIGKDFVIAWFTFSSNPCISLYKPIFLKDSILGSVDYGKEYWLNTEELHRKLINVPIDDYYNVSEKLRKLQEDLINVTGNVRAKFLNGFDIAEEEIDFTMRSIKKIDTEHIEMIRTAILPAHKKQFFNYYRWWNKTNKKLDMFLKKF